MNTKMLMIGVSVALVCAVGFVGTASAGCFADTVLNSSQVTITPNTDCLDVIVEGGGCAGGLSITIENQCAGTLVVQESVFQGTTQEENYTINAQDTGSVGLGTFEENQDQTVLYRAVLDGEAIEIEVTFNAELDESSYEGCSVSSPTKPTPLSPGWLLIGICVMGACLRPRRVV